MSDSEGGKGAPNVAASQSLADQIIDSVHEGVIVYGKDLRYRLWNPYMEHLSGLSAREVLGRQPLDVFPFLEGVGVMDRLRRALAGEAPLPLEFPTETRQGPGWFVDTSAPLLDRAGGVIGVIATVQDVSARKRAEIALDEALSRERAIATNSPDHVFVQDRDLRYRIVLNPPFGWTEEQMLGRTDHDLLPREDADRLTELKRRVLDTKTPLRVEVPLESPTRGREYFDGTYVPSFDAAGEVSGLIGYFRNVTEIREAEQRYRTLFESMPDGAALHELITDEEGHPADYRFLAVNPAFESQTGLRSQDVVGRTVRQVIPDIDPFFIETYGRVCQTGEPVTFRHGEPALEKTFEVSAFCSGPNRFAAVFVDATGEERLRVSEEKFRNLFDNALVGMFRTRLDGSEILDGNAAFLRILGRTRNEVIGSPSVIHWADPGERAEMARRLEQDGRVEDFECRMLTKSGEIRHCITSLTLYAEQGILEGSILDATERRRAEEALRESEGRLRAITRDMPDTILQTDRQGRIVFVNRVAGGISMDRALSSTVFDYVLPEEAPIVAEALAAVFDDGRTCQYESKGPGPDGGWHDFEVRVSPIFVGGQPDSAIFLARDVTARNRAAQERAGLEEQLRQSQKMEAIGTLAGGIAHDFNNLLTPILAHTDLALMQLPDSSPVREDLTQVFTAAQRATEIVRQILTISRSEGPLEAGPVNLAALVKEAMKFLRASIPATIEMSVTTADSTPLVRGTTARLHQVLLNLCANARDAIGDGPGTITVTVGPWQPLENGPWEGMESSGEDWVLLSVRDTGPGIAPELLDRVIEPYFTTKPAEKGTGLGLSVCHGIVAGFGGHLRVRSPPGEGATVAVLLPVLAPQPTEAPPAPESPRGRGEHVLVVDDEAMVARVLARMLVSLGYRVTTLTTAREALELFRSDPSSVDLVVTDYTMPVMTGFALAHALREVRPDVPVLVGTGHAEGVDEEAVTRLRLQGLMRKPYTLAALAAAVTRALSGRPGPP